MVFEVFDRGMCRVEANTLGGVVNNLTRVFNIDAKVTYVFILRIFFNFNYIGALDWTSNKLPSR